MKRRNKKGKGALASHPLLLGLGIGIASVAAVAPAHANTLPVSCTNGPEASLTRQLSSEEVLERIATLRRGIGLDDLHDKVRALLGPNRLEANCFGQSTPNGGCGYSQDSGCSYTQDCSGGGKKALQG